MKKEDMSIQEYLETLSVYPKDKTERVSNRIHGLVLFLVELAANNSWKAESKAWKHLFCQQRGGEAFDAIQKDLAEARAEIDRLKKENKVITTQSN